MGSRQNFITKIGDQGKVFHSTFLIIFIRSDNFPHFTRPISQDRETGQHVFGAKVKA